MKTDEEYKINKLTVCSRRLDRWGLEQLGGKAGPTFVFHSPFSKLLSNKPNAWSRAMNQQINKIKLLIHEPNLRAISLTAIRLQTFILWFSSMLTSAAFNIINLRCQIKLSIYVYVNGTLRMQQLQLRALQVYF